MEKTNGVWLAILACAIGLIGCGQGQTGGATAKIVVTDNTGKPIAGASVEAVSLSTTTGPQMTDAAGQASIPFNAQGTKWVKVSAPGYQAVQVDMSSASPLRVTLGEAIDAGAL